MDCPPRPRATLRVRVRPRSSRNQVLGYRGDALRLAVTAPPEGGRANEAVISLLAEVLGVARSQVTIARGRTSRDKMVAVESLSPDQVRQRLSTRVQ